MLSVWNLPPQRAASEQPLNVQSALAKNRKGPVLVV